MKKYYDSDISSVHFSFADFIKTKRTRINEELFTSYFDEKDIFVGDIYDSYKLKDTHIELSSRNDILLKINDNSYIDISSLKTKKDILDLLDKINNNRLDEKLIMYNGIFIINENNKLVLNIRPYVFKNKKSRQKVFSLR